jgi:hypothetical protein
VQNRFNLLDRSGVQVLVDCEAQEIMFVPYFPLAWLLRRSTAMVVIPARQTPINCAPTSAQPRSPRT